MVLTRKQERSIIVAFEDFEGYSVGEVADWTPLGEGLGEGLGELRPVDLETLANTEGLAFKDWSEERPEERLKALRSMEDTLAGCEKRPAREVVLDDTLGEGTFGYYNPGDGKIHLNGDLVADECEWLEGKEQWREAIGTVVHEGRHAFQHDAVDWLEEHPEVQSVNAELAGELAAWRHNMEHYLPGDIYGDYIYQNQPIEKDAFGFENKYTGMLEGMLARA